MYMRVGPVHRLRDTEYNGYGHQGGYGVWDRVGRGRGYTGYYPATLKADLRQRSGPRKPLLGGWSGWSQGSARGLFQVPPFGPAPCGRCTWARSPSKPASWPIRARIHDISWKVSQNGQVSPEMS